MGTPRKIICYPLKPKGGSQWGNMELRHSLRSIEQHWRGGYDDVYILGAWMPDWINTEKVKFQMAPQYTQALEEAVRLAGPGGHILWMNDDILLMQDTGWEDLVSPVRREGASQMTREQAAQWCESDNGWMRRLGQIMLSLHDRGCTTWKFSTHTPYWYEADKLKPLLDEFLHLGYKVAIENAYFNLHLDELGGPIPCADKFRTGSAKRKIPMKRVESVRFLNLTPNIGEWMKGFIRGRFSVKSNFEL
jgi:hypothetical protein